jgi:hypothetical protein
MRPRNHTSSRCPRGSYTGRQQCHNQQEGKGDGTPGGVFDRGAHGRDGPETWEALAIPLEDTGDTESRLSQSPTGTRKRMLALPGKEEAFAQEVGRKQGEPELRPKVDRESEGCIRAKTPGNGVAPGAG